MLRTSQQTSSWQWHVVPHTDNIHAYCACPAEVSRQEPSLLPTQTNAVSQSPTASQETRAALQLICSWGPRRQAFSNKRLWATVTVIMKLCATFRQYSIDMRINFFSQSLTDAVQSCALLEVLHGATCSATLQTWSLRKQRQKLHATMLLL